MTQTESFHLLAYNSSAATGFTDSQVSAVAEQQYNRNNNSFQIPDPTLLHLAFATCVGFSRARVNQGSLLPYGLPQIWPGGNTAGPPTPLPLADWRDNPLQLRKEEDLRIDGTHTDAGTQRFTVGLFVSKAPLNYNVPSQKLRWVRFTAAPTETAYTWCSPVTITFQDQLAAGTYDIWGLDIQSANTIFARLVLPGMWSRPGVVARTLLTDWHTPVFRGGMGKFGSFNLYSLPQIETLATTAGAATLEGRVLISQAG